MKNQLTSGQLQLWLRQQPRADRSRFQPVVHNEPAADFQLNPPRSSSDTFPVQPPMASPSGPTPPLVNPSSVVGPTKKTRPNPVGKLSENWTPDRLVARKSVRLRTPQLAADVEFAEIELEQSGIDAKASGDSLQGPTLAGPLLSNPLGNQSQAGSTERYQLAGHEVRIVMQANGPETSPRFKSVSIQGGVRLVQSSANPDVAGLDVQGTKVELTQTDEGAVGSIVGEPAIVKTQGVEVSGTEIQVDQAANRVWIDNAGLAYIPLPQNVAARFSKKTATMKIAWQGGMNFDGEAVTCGGGVEIRGPEQIATAQALRVTLVEPIRFDSAGRELNTMKSRRSRNVNEPNQILSQVALTGNVWLENRSFDDRGRASIDEFRVATLNYDQSTGQLVGEGPGTMSSKRFTQNKVDSQRSQTPQLTHTLVQFQKQLHGSLKKREVSVSDRVRAIHGPIADWKQENRFDAPSQSPDTVTMKAARLTVAQMPGNAGQPALEFTASGDTEIRGRTFVANAQHVRYAQAKDMLVMEGDGRSIVQLSHQSRIGAPRQVVKAKKIQYWIAANRLNSEGVIMGDVTVADSASKFLQRGQPYGQTQQLASPYQQPQYRGNPNAQRPLGQQPVQNYGVQNPALVNPSYGNPNMLNPANRQATPNGVYGRFPQPNRQP